MRQNDIRIKSAVVSLSLRRLRLRLLCLLPPLLCVSGEWANVSMKKEIIRSCVSPLFWSSFGSLVVGLFSFVCKKKKKRAPLLSSIIVSMLVSAEGHSEREREREKERDEFNK